MDLVPTDPHPSKNDSYVHPTAKEEILTSDAF